jgi:hypothetical protein
LFLTWNIGRNINIIKSKDIIEYFSKFDIIALVETWLCDTLHIPYLSPLYVTYDCFARQSSSHGRNMGGVIVFNKHKLSGSLQRIEENFNHGVVFKDKS